MDRIFACNAAIFTLIISYLFQQLSCLAKSSCILQEGQIRTADASDWTAEEQAQFEEGLRENDRDFVETVKMGILTSKPIARQVGYYYNVWKTLSTDRARLWYYNLNEVRGHAQLLVAVLPCGFFHIHLDGHSSCAFC